MDQPEVYAKYNSPQRQDAVYVIENYFKFVKLRRDGSDAILDIGCGSGDVTMEVLHPSLPQEIRKLVGCDISDSMLDYAKNKYKRPYLSFVKVDIGTLTIPMDMEGEFDHVFSFNCLHWVQNQTQAFKNIFNMLKPDGDMLIEFLIKNPHFNMYKNLQNNRKWESYMKDALNFISPYENVENPEKDFESLLKKTGFSVHVCQVIDRLFVFNSMDSLRNLFGSVNPFLKRIPKEKQDNFLDDCANEIRNMCSIEKNNDDEKIHLTYSFLVAFASKGEM